MMNAARCGAKYAVSVPVLPIKKATFYVGTKRKHEISKEHVNIVETNKDQVAHLTGGRTK